MSGPSEKKKLTGFLKGPDIKCFVIFSDFHGSESKQSTRYLYNTNLILKTTE